MYDILGVETLDHMCTQMKRFDFTENPLNEFSMRKKVNVFNTFD